MTPNIPDEFVVITEKEGLLRNSAGYRGLETGLLERRGCHHADRRGLRKKRGRVQRFSRRLSRMQVRKTKAFFDFTILKAYHISLSVLGLLTIKVTARQTFSFLKLFESFQIS